MRTEIIVNLDTDISDYSTETTEDDVIAVMRLAADSLADKWQTDYPEAVININVGRYDPLPWGNRPIICEDGEELPQDHNAYDWLRRDIDLAVENAWDRYCQPQEQQ